MASETNLDLITAAYRMLTVIDEVTPPSAEQAAVGLTVLNNMMANMDADGIRLGWYPQTTQTAVAPLNLQDIRGVKLLLAYDLSTHYGVTIDDKFTSQVDSAYRNLVKRSIEYFDSDLTGLPFSQGGLFGPGRV